MKPKGFDPARFRRAKACVLGLGKSGAAASNLLARKGFRVFASEASPRSKVSLDSLDRRIEAEFGGHTKKTLEADFAVKSPGLPSDLPVLKAFRKEGKPVFSELEVALAFCPSKKVWAVSGTNGKTTTTALLGAILEAAGRKARVCGNIGVPASREAPLARPGDDIVLEVSSYQLEDSVVFHPKVAALLNITPDHLEHHRSLSAYAAAKARLFSQQTARDVCVVNAADARAVQASEAGAARRLFFGPGLSDASISDGRLAIRLGGRTHELRPPSLLGRHNLENAAAAALMAASQGVPYAAIQAAFDGFRGVEHRLERAGAVDGIVCVNDSKATNVDSTRVALEAFDGEGRRLLLILGGRDKGAPYRPLSPLIRRTTRTILTIGEAAPLIERQLSGAAPFVRCGALRKAVREGLRRGRPGDILLLSPACASFDQFANFEERGREFKRLLRRAGAR